METAVYAGLQISFSLISLLFPFCLRTDAMWEIMESEPKGSIYNHVKKKAG